MHTHIYTHKTRAHTHAYRMVDVVLPVGQLPPLGRAVRLLSLPHVGPLTLLAQDAHTHTHTHPHTRTHILTCTFIHTHTHTYTLSLSLSLSLSVSLESMEMVSKTY